MAGLCDQRWVVEEVGSTHGVGTTGEAKERDMQAALSRGVEVCATAIHWVSVSLCGREDCKGT